MKTDLYKEAHSWVFLFLIRDSAGYNRKKIQILLNGQKKAYQGIGKPENTYQK
ncbi:hypothetical protein [Acinetobacter wanghuae]|uniref:Uncharacterized protein n=1 Tax=Acinetobacter wanghuae TaxID=2662362 RepID=A0AA90WFR9_9GAMM|nr:hypothetical protein [Acinetobacter wanghuae]MQW93078.1 hypothetical protein [Acinetobacter wanghuae]